MIKNLKVIDKETIEVTKEIQRTYIKENLLHRKQIHEKRLAEINQMLDELNK